MSKDFIIRKKKKILMPDLISDLIPDLIPDFMRIQFIVTFFFYKELFSMK